MPSSFPFLERNVIHVTEIMAHASGRALERSNYQFKQPSGSKCLTHSFAVLDSSRAKYKSTQTSPPSKCELLSKFYPFFAQLWNRLHICLLYCLPPKVEGRGSPATSPKSSISPLMELHKSPMLKSSSGDIRIWCPN
jgi:hypothetical protein